jgi:hypothetical protein
LVTLFSFHSGEGAIALLSTDCLFSQRLSRHGFGHRTPAGKQYSLLLESRYLALEKNTIDRISEFISWSDTVGNNAPGVYHTPSSLHDWRT